MTEWLEQEEVSLAELQPVQYRKFLEHTSWGEISQHNAFYCLRPYLRWRYGKDHPLMRMRVKRPSPSPQRTLNLEQAVQLVSSIDTREIKGVRDLAIVSLLLDTGLRAAELCRLRLTHLNVGERKFAVLAKGRTWREGVFSEVTAERLAVWLDIRPAIAKRQVRTAFVATGGSTPGQPLTRRGLGIILRRLGVKAGIGPISPHDFRRTFATLSLKRGAPTRLVQIAGGWKKIDMVERYSQALETSDFEGYFPATLTSVES